MILHLLTLAMAMSGPADNAGPFVLGEPLPNNISGLDLLETRDNRQYYTYYPYIFGEAKTSLKIITCNNFIWIIYITVYQPSNITSWLEPDKHKNRSHNRPYIIEKLESISQEVLENYSFLGWDIEKPSEYWPFTVHPANLNWSGEGHIPSIYYDPKLIDIYATTIKYMDTTRLLSVGHKYWRDNNYDGLFLRLGPYQECPELPPDLTGYQ